MADVAPVPANARTTVHGWSNVAALTDDRPKVVLIGDSVLDNFVWLNDPTSYLRTQLQSLLQDSSDFSNYTCINLAVDQQTTYDFLCRTRAGNDCEYLLLSL
jgi:hypothetical protein